MLPRDQMILKVFDLLDEIVGVSLVHFTLDEVAAHLNAFLQHPAFFRLGTTFIFAILTFFKLAEGTLVGACLVSYF